MSFISSFWQAVNPPKSGATDEQLYYWRLIMVLLSMATTAMLFAHLAWVAGAFPYFESEALAKKSEVQALVKMITEKDKANIVVDIVNIRQQHCSSKGVAKNMYRERLTTLQEEYKDLQGSDFVLPPCTDFSN